MAAWEIKYRIEFKDVVELTWKIDILEYLDADPGITTLTATGEPLHIDYECDQDDFNNPILTSKAIFNVMSSTDFLLIDLYSEEDLHFKVNIYTNTTLCWQGWIITGEYTEPYDTPPYPVQISALCGLNYLKHFLYKYETLAPDDTYYNGRTRESEIILDILAKIGITEFTEYVNLYEASMWTGSSDSPFDQTMIDVDIFKDMYCYEVLSEILKKYDATICQVNGKMVITRPVEMIQSNVYGRTFTDTLTKADAATITPNALISRTGAITALKQFPGGMLTTRRTAKKLTILQDYGNKVSWIENWDLNINTCTLGGAAEWTYSSWDNYGGWVSIPLQNYLPSEKFGVFIMYNTYDSLAKYISQSFATHALATSDVICFELEYLFYNNVGTAKSNIDFFISIKSDSESQYLKSTADEEYLSWDASSSYILITDDALLGVPEWKTYKRKIASLPSDGSYTINIYGINDADGSSIYVGIRNIKFYSTSDVITSIKRGYAMKAFEKINRVLFPIFKRKRDLVIYTDNQEVVSKEYTITNALNGIELELDYIIGDVTDSNIDNVIEQYAGALATIYPTLTIVAAAFVIDHAADYIAGGVVVTSLATAIIMTSSTAGTNFTGATTITNVVGDLSGIVVATQANRVAVARVDKILLIAATGASTANITCENITKIATWDTSITITADNFVAAFASFYDAANVTLTAVTGTLIFTAKTAGTDFVHNNTGFDDISGDMGGTVTAPFTANVTALKRIDTITLSGSSGIANILCDAITKTATWNMSYSSEWNTYTGTGAGRTSGGEADTLIELIGAEIANQYSRPKQLIQINISDRTTTGPIFKLNAYIQDSINLVAAGGNARKFIFKSGGLSARSRMWDCDLIEIIE